MSLLCLTPPNGEPHAFGVRGMTLGIGAFETPRQLIGFSRLCSLRGADGVLVDAVRPGAPPGFGAWLPSGETCQARDGHSELFAPMNGHLALRLKFRQRCREKTAWGRTRYDTTSQCILKGHLSPKISPLTALPTTRRTTNLAPTTSSKANHYAARRFHLPPEITSTCSNFRKPLWTEINIATPNW
jgi:hypothetical protein